MSKTKSIWCKGIIVCALLACVTAPPFLTSHANEVERGLRRGAIAVGFGVQYVPQASRAEILEMFRVAGVYPGRPVRAPDSSLLPRKTR